MKRFSERFDVNLVGYKGPLQDLVFKILVEAVTLGRHSSNDIVIDDPTVSGHHARIIYDGIGFDIEDLGSKTGIRVNGRVIERAEIRDGDQIRVGKSILVFSAKPQGKQAQQIGDQADLLSRSTQLDSGARVRMGIYGIVIFLLLLVIILLGLQTPGGGDGDKVRIDGQIVEIGTLAVESFDPGTQVPTDDQIRQASLHLQRGINAFDAGNLLEAIEEFKTSLRDNPGCSACESQLEWAIKQLKKKIAYHYQVAREEYSNLRYAQAVRELDLILKLAGPEDAIGQKAQILMESAREKQAALDRRAVGLQ